MGITFLAAGTSVPEAVSSVIVAKRGNLVYIINICHIIEQCLLLQDMVPWASVSI